jgi:hypothetical protein
LAPVPLWIVAKLALYWAIRELGIQAALEAVGKRVVMSYDDAA